MLIFVAFPLAQGLACVSSNNPYATVMITPLMLTLAASRLGERCTQIVIAVGVAFAAVYYATCGRNIALSGTMYTFTLNYMRCAVL